MKFIFVRQSNADSRATKIPFAGADDPAEVLLPEPSQDALRLAELEQEKQTAA